MTKLEIACVIVGFIGMVSMALNRNDNSVGIRTKTDSYDIRFETYDEASDLIGEIYAKL